MYVLYWSIDIIVIGQLLKPPFIKNWLVHTFCASVVVKSNVSRVGLLTDLIFGTLLYHNEWEKHGSVGSQGVTRGQQQANYNNYVSTVCKCTTFSSRKLQFVVVIGDFRSTGVKLNKKLCKNISKSDFIISTTLGRTYWLFLGRSKVIMGSVCFNYVKRNDQYFKIDPSKDRLCYCDTVCHNVILLINSDWLHNAAYQLKLVTSSKSQCIIVFFFCFISFRTNSPAELFWYI